MATTGHERDHARDGAPPATDHDPAASPGRSSRTEHLAGPGGPKVSGLLMRKADAATRPEAAGDDGGISDEAAELMAAAEASPASSLPDGVRGELEGELGADLGHVRVHDGAEAHAAASALDARAFTVGRDMYFASGAYAPASPVGRGLIAHEAAHVVQSGGVGSVGAGMQLSSPGDAHELEAHAFGEAFGSGMAAPAPVARAGGVARAIVSRAEADPVVIPKTNKTTGGASGKISTKSASFNAYVSFTQALTGPETVADAQLILQLGGAGTLEWPDLMPAGGPSLEKSGGGASSSDHSSTGKGEYGVEQEIELYKSKANSTAKEDKSWWDGFEVESVNLIPGVSGGAEDGKSAAGERKSEHGGGLGVKCEAKLKNGATVTGSVNIVSLKKGEGELEIEGPNLTLVAGYSPTLKEYDLGKGVKAKVTLSGSATVVVKPNWKALAREAAELMVEMGAAGAVELAGTMVVIFGPALFFAAGLSMIEDEDALWQWAVGEAKQCQRSATALASGTAMGGDRAGGMRATMAYTKGNLAALKAIASSRCTKDAYKAQFEQAGAYGKVYRQALLGAGDAFRSAVRTRAKEMYKASTSMNVFKQESDVLHTWEEKANTAWLSALQTS